MKIADNRIQVERFSVDCPVGRILYVAYSILTLPIEGATILGTPGRLKPTGGFCFGGLMKAAVLIDGGYLRASAKAAGIHYDNRFIERFAENCFVPSEYTFRIYYYDAPQFRGTRDLPVSNRPTTFQSNDRWLVELAKLPRFAVRRGSIGFRGWKPRAAALAAGAPLTDADFEPIFEQKGVDMRIGLDIASLSERRAVERIILVSGDQDMVPAMKHARKAGLEVTLIQMPAPTKTLHDELQSHADVVRLVAWPVLN